MPLIAILAANEPVADDERELRACLPFAGRTVLERQAEFAIAAGADEIWVAVKSVPPALTRALDGIAEQGVKPRPFRRLQDVIATLRADDRLLLIADAAIVPAPAVQRLAGLGDAAVLIADEGPLTMAFERLSPHARWAGIAAAPASLAAQAAHLPDDWDPVSTLLRCIVQQGGRMIAADRQALDRGEVAILSTHALAAAAESRLLAANGDRQGGLARRYLFGPLARLSAVPLVRRKTRAAGPFVAASAMMIAGAAALVGGYIMPGASLFLAAMLFTAMGDFVLRIAPFRPIDRQAAAVARCMGAFLPLMLVIGTSGITAVGRQNDRAIDMAAIALTLPCLWFAQRTLRRVHVAHDRPSDLMLHDDEAFALLLWAFALAGLPTMALPLGLGLTGAGLLAWLVLLERRRTKV